MSIFAPIIGPYDPDQMDMLNALQGPSLAHLFGTDQVGRDIFTRLMYGARTTLLSALLVVVISIIIGIPLGVISGYYGGKIDSVIMRAEDVLLAFPALLLAFLFVASFGKGIANAIIALGKMVKLTINVIRCARVHIAMMLLKHSWMKTKDILMMMRNK